MENEANHTCLFFLLVRNLFFKFFANVNNIPGCRGGAEVDREASFLFSWIFFLTRLGGAGDGGY